MLHKYTLNAYHRGEKKTTTLNEPCVYSETFGTTKKAFRIRISMGIVELPLQRARVVRLYCTAFPSSHFIYCAYNLRTLHKPLTVKFKDTPTPFTARNKLRSYFEFKFTFLFFIGQKERNDENKNKFYAFTNKIFTNTAPRSIGE